ncbi:hypothetical protein JKP75_15640 [Blastococcus sp. TML/M2B]|uniref:hypothetical protein n=1 Tax=Blastococcus sp. TML/M2B TaxID=2798727 RepID=UPI00190D36B2|nr:hypothetical protein [Blastococcus sp. TML/M2B]MBN1093858.1 hypothetical protein [Blastococcus sp. TML/M2B]
MASTAAAAKAPEASSTLWMRTSTTSMLVSQANESVRSISTVLLREKALCPVISRSRVCQPASTATATIATSTATTTETAPRPAARAATASSSRSTWEAVE